MVHQFEIDALHLLFNLGYQNGFIVCKDISLLEYHKTNFQEIKCKSIYTSALDIFAPNLLHLQASGVAQWSKHTFVVELQRVNIINYSPFYI